MPLGPQHPTWAKLYDAPASFASIYAVVVWFDEACQPFVVRSAMRRALPEIERLTVSLPPAGGPGRNAGEAKSRA